MPEPHINTGFRHFCFLFKLGKLRSWLKLFLFKFYLKSTDILSYLHTLFWLTDFLLPCSNYNHSQQKSQPFLLFHNSIFVKEWFLDNAFPHSHDQLRTLSSHPMFHLFLRIFQTISLLIQQAIYHH